MILKLVHKYLNRNSERDWWWRLVCVLYYSDINRAMALIQNEIAVNFDRRMIFMWFGLLNMYLKAFYCYQRALCIWHTLFLEMDWEIIIENLFDGHGQNGNVFVIILMDFWKIWMYGVGAEFNLSYLKANLPVRK